MKVAAETKLEAAHAEADEKQAKAEAEMKVAAEAKLEAAHLEAAAAHGQTEAARAQAEAEVPAPSNTIQPYPLP